MQPTRRKKRGTAVTAVRSSGLHYFVGGNSKVYGDAVLFRLHERNSLRHEDGISPAWHVHRYLR
jgi:hypothetical protein